MDVDEEEEWQGIGVSLLSLDNTPPPDPESTFSDKPSSHSSTSAVKNSAADDQGEQEGSDSDSSSDSDESTSSGDSDESDSSSDSDESDGSSQLAGRGGQAVPTTPPSLPLRPAGSPPSDDTSGEDTSSEDTSGEYLQIVPALQNPS